MRDAGRGGAGGAGGGRGGNANPTLGPGGARRRGNRQPESVNNDPLKQPDLKLRELAASPIDANTLALGDPNSVRSVIDASAGRKRNNDDLIALATRNPGAIIGFGGNISPQVLKNLDVGNASFAGDLSGVRQAYGSVDTNEKDVAIFIGAKTVDADSAKNLGDTIEGLKQFGALFMGRLTGAKGVLAKSALTNLKITTQANELQITTAVAQADIGPLMGN